MKIAILGTRGIPNNHGGFEQCAEKLSQHFTAKGHEVTVYNTNEHPYKKKNYGKIRIEHIFAQTNKLKFFGTFIYDLLCIIHAQYQNYDIILELGYSPAALFYPLRINKKNKLITNMDGIGSQRTKYSILLKSFTKLCERFAINYSDALIADNLGIQKYFYDKHNAKSYYIPYGATIPTKFDSIHLQTYKLNPFSYYMLMARLEPENNIEMILDGYSLSNSDTPFIVFGDYNTRYGKILTKKYSKNSKIYFTGCNFNYDTISSLRYFALLYFHGHTVGGTNPSLLEAMASKANIVAHDNIFNKSILQENALYFKNSSQIKEIIIDYTDKDKDKDKDRDRDRDRDRGRNKLIKANTKRIIKLFNWEKISDSYLNLFHMLLHPQKQERTHE